MCLARHSSSFRFEPCRICFLPRRVGRRATTSCRRPRRPAIARWTRGMSALARGLLPGRAARAPWARGPPGGRARGRWGRGGTAPPCFTTLTAIRSDLRSPPTPSLHHHPRGWAWRARPSEAAPHRVHHPPTTSPRRERAANTPLAVAPAIPRVRHPLFHLSARAPSPSPDHKAPCSPPPAPAPARAGAAPRAV